jgi:predicted ATPase
VLDNVEHLPEAAPFVAGLLAACPRLVVLATSRAPLRLRGERELPVPPLPLPRRKPPPSPAQLSHYDAVRLFVERARAVRPDFAVTEENAPAVAEICRRWTGCRWRSSSPPPASASSHPRRCWRVSTAPCRC